MPKRRHLTAKQKEAGFGGKRNMHPYARKHTVRHKGIRRSVKRASSRSSGSSTASTAIKVAIGAALGIAGAALEAWVSNHGGWSTIIDVFRTSGISGLISFATGSGGSATSMSPNTPPVTGLPTPLKFPVYGSGIPGYVGGSGGTVYAPNPNDPSTWETVGGNQDTNTQNLVAAGGSVSDVVDFGVTQIAGHYFDEFGNLIM